MADAILAVSGIYAIRNKINGKQYIGSAANFRRRFAEHKNALVANRHHSQKLQRAWLKYGSEQFEFLILEPVELIDQLIVREQTWIDRFQAATRSGYNVSPTAGSPAGVKHTAEARANMSEAQKRRPPIADSTREKLSAAGVRRTLSATSRAKISASNKGVKRSPEVVAANSAARIGRPIPEVTRLKMSIAAKGRVHTPQALTLMSSSKKGVALSEAHKAALKAAHKGMTGRKHSPETIEKMAATQRRLAAAKNLIKQGQANGI